VRLCREKLEFIDLSETAMSIDGLPAIRRWRLARGYLIALVLSLIFLALTAYHSAATLLTRLEETSVMRAASGAAISGRIGIEVAAFLLTQLALHAAFAAAAWGLAVASGVIWPEVREKLGRMVVGWFSLLATATIAYNAYWYPRTLMGAYYNDIVAINVGPWPLGRIIYLGVAGCGIAVLTAALWKKSRRLVLFRSVRRAGIVLLIAGAGVATAIWAASSPHYNGSVGGRPPHVIILGIDSLRLEHLQRYGGTGTTPNLDVFLTDADLLRDTTTPAARTFSSWTAILTGRSPTVTGARFNLAARSSVAANPTIGDVLRSEGYRTVYSTDEVRFANIDESFGFDQVIAPRIGASDFLIGTYNELPLATVVVNTRLGQWLFPFSHANRGVASMFRPETYLDRVERELSFDAPTLFIAHLTAAHWPYFVSDTPFGISNPDGSGEHPLYHVGLETADEMFGQMVDLLRRKGALDNAVVVVLSDHGEAFGLPGDTPFGENNAFFIEGLRAPIKMKDHGHGQSVLSPSQYKVLLGFRSFGSHNAFSSSGREWNLPVTVEDIAPTILGLLDTLGDPLNATGRSLAPLLRGDTSASPELAMDRVRYTETDLSVLPAPGGGVDEAATARQNSMFFNVDYSTGRLEISKRYEPLAIAFKERAAFTRNQLLAALPAGPYAHQYLLFDLTTGNGQLLLGPPGADQRDAQRLWNALHTHFDGELKPAVAVTRDDWARIDQEWRDFLHTYERQQVARPPSSSAEPAAAAGLSPGDSSSRS
jgi:hypothetical protein